MSSIRTSHLAVHDLVRTCFAEGVDEPSRVEDVEDDIVWVAVPTDGSMLLHRHGEDSLAIQWIAPRGRFTQPVRFLGAEMRSIPTWRLQMVGEPTIEQLREFVRVDAAVPISTTTVPEEGGEPVTISGTTVDLSEGGVRCMLVTPGLTADSEVVVHLSLGTHDIDVPARVLRSVRGLHGRSEVVFVFERSNHADELRRFVFAQQVRARAASRA
jgi:hypothetical protein